MQEHDLYDPLLGMVGVYEEVQEVLVLVEGGREVHVLMGKHRWVVWG